MVKLRSYSESEISWFRRKDNKKKVALTLNGILEGIVADQQLKEIEVLFLQMWIVNEASEYDDGDILDLKEQIKDVLSDGYLSEEELSDTKQLLIDILDYTDAVPDNIDDLIRELLGFLQGITSDGVLTEDEILILSKKFELAPELAEQWPGNVIKQRLNAILDDKIITKEESSELLAVLNGIAGQKFYETGMAGGLSTSFVIDSIDEFNFTGKKLCFTGKFVSGTRKMHREFAKEMGSVVTDNITQDTDCLVLGGIANKDWKFTSYGRKIESVLKNREKGANTIIINEPTWCAFAGI